MKILKTLLQGRYLLSKEIKDQELLKNAIKKNLIKVIDGITVKNGVMICNRCHALLKPNTSHNSGCNCEKECYYCRNCIQLGKITSCQQLYTWSDKNESIHFKHVEKKWTQTLSPIQEEASRSVGQAMLLKKNLLYGQFVGLGKPKFSFKGFLTQFREWNELLSLRQE